MNENQMKQDTAKKTTAPNMNAAAAGGKMNAGKKEESVADKVGGAIEHLGDKVAQAGAPKVGQAIYNAGDKVEEHHKNPNHPRNVKK